MNSSIQTGEEKGTADFIWLAKAMAKEAGDSKADGAGRDGPLSVWWPPPCSRTKQSKTYQGRVRRPPEGFHNRIAEPNQAKQTPAE